MTGEKMKDTEMLEVRPGEFEPLPMKHDGSGPSHPFLVSLGKALVGEKIDNRFLRANLLPGNNISQR
jgi:hypothetical protein